MVGVKLAKRTHSPVPKLTSRSCAQSMMQGLPSVSLNIKGALTVSSMACSRDRPLGWPADTSAITWGTKEWKPL